MPLQFLPPPPGRAGGDRTAGADGETSGAKRASPATSCLRRAPHLARQHRRQRHPLPQKQLQQLLRLPPPRLHPGESVLEIPVIASLTTKPLDIGFFHFHRRRRVLLRRRPLRRLPLAVTMRRRRTPADTTLLELPRLAFHARIPRWLRLSVDQRSLIVIFLGSSPLRL